MKNDTALAQLREVLPFAEFARKHPLVFSSADPTPALDLHQLVHVDLQPSPWPINEPQCAIATVGLRQPGVIAALLDGGTAIIGTPRSIYRHIRDEATVRFWLGPSAGAVDECLDVSCHLVSAGRKLRSVVA